MEFNISGKSNLSAFSTVAALTLWSFIGLESASVPADDVENPRKTIPRATILGTLLAAVVYILGMIAVLGAVPAAELSQSTAPFADAAQAMFGGRAGSIVALGAIIACFGTLNGWVLIQAQISKAIAQDNLFPAVFAKVSKNGSPVHGLIIASLLTTILLTFTLSATLIESFTFMILLASLAALLLYLFTSMAEVIILKREENRLDKKGVARSIVIACLAFAYSFWAIIGSGQETVFYGILLLFTGIPVYVWMQIQSKKA